MMPAELTPTIIFNLQLLQLLLLLLLPLQSRGTHFQLFAFLQLVVNSFLRAIHF